MVLLPSTLFAGAWYKAGLCVVLKPYLHAVLPSSSLTVLLFQCLLHRGELESAFDMDAVVGELGDSLTVLEASALSGLNVKAIMDWTKSIYGII